MSLKRKFFSLITLAVGVVGLSTFVSAQETTKTAPKDGTQTQERQLHKGFGDHGGGFRGEHGGGPMGMLRGITLTDAQKEQIHTILESNRPDKAAMEELHTLMQAKRDGTITAEQQDRLKTLRDQAREKGQSVHQQIVAILTPEQLAQVEKNKQEMKQRFEERRQQREQNKVTPEKPTNN
jgi:Spy/CpxP family protein refolding chaperone